MGSGERQSPMTRGAACSPRGPGRGTDPPAVIGNPLRTAAPVETEKF